jgi:hypothetical protein
MSFGGHSACSPRCKLDAYLDQVCVSANIPDTMRRAVGPGPPAVAVAAGG